MSVSFFLIGIAAILGTAFLSFVAVQVIYAKNQTARRYFLDRTATRLDAAWISLRRRWHRGDRLLAALLALGHLYTVYREHKRVTFPGTLDLFTVHAVAFFSVAAIGTDLWDVGFRAFEVLAPLFVGCSWLVVTLSWSGGTKE